MVLKLGCTWNHTDNLKERKERKEEGGKKEVKKEDQLFLSPNSRYSDLVGLKCILGINIVLKGPQMALTCSQVEPLMV